LETSARSKILVCRLAVAVFPSNTPPFMISPKKLVFGLLSVVFLALASGCTSPRRDTSIPWSRPADWEGQIPGMGSSMGR
jgi:hypothetical protein